MLFPPAAIIILSSFSPLPYNTTVPRLKGMKLGNHGQSWETGGRTGEGIRGVTDKDCAAGAALLMSYYDGNVTLPAWDVLTWAEQHRTRMEGSEWVWCHLVRLRLPEEAYGSGGSLTFTSLCHLLPMDPGHVYAGVTGKVTSVKCASRYWIAERLGTLLWWLCTYVLLNNNYHSYCFESVVCQVHGPER